VSTLQDLSQEPVKESGREVTLEPAPELTPDLNLQPVGQRRGLGLSGKLLLLTIPLILVAAMLLYVPAVTNYWHNRLNDHIAAARTAALILDAAPSGAVPDSLQHQILDTIGARLVAIQSARQRRLMVSANLPMGTDHDIDIRTLTPWTMIVGTFRTMLESGNQVIRIRGPGPEGSLFIEVVVDQAPLREMMHHFSRNVLLIAVMISLLIASMVHFALHFLFVRPMRRLTVSLIGFHDNPECSTRIITPSRRGDEIGVAERELSDMQRHLMSMLHQKSRLAALGLAVAKINHDLRNLLASAQLLSDQLISVPDPHVQRLAPKLVRSLERAIVFCQSTLSYGRSQDPAPVRRMFLLDPVVAEVREMAGLAADSSITWTTAIEPGMSVDADPEQMLRVLLNLARNALQALESQPATTRQIRVNAWREGAVAIIEVSDTGPGVSAKARERLFAAFQTTNRVGGTGLGLAIAAEVVRAHGGSIRLLDTSHGATFRIELPDQPVEFLSIRNARAGARAN